MSTFLELSQKTAGDSGTTEPGYSLPTTVVGQTGKLENVVRWVQDAWRRLQNERADWLWMQAEFTGTLSSGTHTYAAGALGDATLASRFADWIRPDKFSVYLTSAGAADERGLYLLPWECFYERRTRGTIESGYPSEMAVDPSGALRFSPTPDAAYTVRGRYRKTPQELAADADVPELPARFHDLIWLGALLRLAADEESYGQLGVWREDYGALKSDLLRDQTPRMTRAPGFG